jgi:uncharacterized membrane protein YgdD (TMEM256/DUF423 family)
MNKRIFIVGAVLCMLAVVLGAFGAHGLKEKIQPGDLENWKTGVQYQFFHALALVVLSHIELPEQRVKASFWTFLFGIILFSGSLYLLSTRSLTGLSGIALGPLTPIGGLLLIAGWAALILGAAKIK